jgi:transposase
VAAREAAGLTVVDAAAALTAIADARARDKAIAKAAEELSKAHAALERAATDSTRQKAHQRIARAREQQKKALMVTANRLERWSERKLTAAEHIGRVSEAQVADLSTVYQVGEDVRTTMTSLARQARIVRSTISRDSAGRWHVAITAEIPRQIRAREVKQEKPDGTVAVTFAPAPSKRQQAGGVVGVDFGVRDTLTLSTGDVITNPAPLEAAQRRLRRAQQAVARRTRRGQPSSGRRLKAAARVGKIHIGKIHNRVALMRERHLQRTASSLIHSYAVIGLEGYDIATRNSRAEEHARWTGSQEPRHSRPITSCSPPTGAAM